MESHAADAQGSAGALDRRSDGASPGGAPRGARPEDALQLAEELQTLLDVLPVGVFIARDPDCDDIRSNPAGAAMLGINAAANASKSGPAGDGLPFRVLKDGQEVPAEDLPMQIAAREGIDIRGEEYEVVHDDGRRVHLFEYASPIRAPDGRVNGSLGVFVDITERKRAEETKALLAAIVESSDDAILSVAPEGTITSWNAGAERLYGYTASEAIGRPLAMLVPPEQRDEERELLERVLRGGHVRHYRTVQVAKDGTLVDVSLGISPVRDPSGRIIGASKVAHDVTDQLRVERALRESEERNRQLLRAGRDALYVYPVSEDGVPGRFVDVNDEACRRLGWSREELQERTIEDVAAFPPERIRELLKELLRAGRASGQAEHRTRGGRLVPVEVSAEVVRLSGSPHVVAVARDVTERLASEQALRESEQRYRRLFDQVAVGIGRQSLDRVVAEANPGFCRMLGYTADELVGKTSPELGHPDDEERSNEVMRALLAGEKRSISIEKRLRHKDGHYVWVQITASLERGPEGNPQSIVGVVQDFTARRRAEEELREADRRKDEFLAVLAHELRNPLAPISHAAELLARLPPDHASRGELVRILGEQSRHIGRLVDDLLDVSRISRGKIELRPELVALSEVATAVHQTALPLAEAAGHVLEVRESSGPLFVLVDRVRLAQVLTNLLANAIKYTPRGGTITLEIARAGGDAVARVRDTGVGIPPEWREQIFEMFRQIDDGAGIGRSGLGIGLTLARQLVELHGGTIEVESEGIDCGSTFTVRLPLRDPSVAGPRPDGSRCRGPDRPRRVLVVDDAAVVADTLGLMFESLGHEVRCCYDGASALEQARAWQPELVVSDLAMPGLDGFELARRLRAGLGPDVACPRLVALSGYGDATARARSAQAGFEHHLVKPATLADLEALLAPA